MMIKKGLQLFYMSSLLFVYSIKAMEEEQVKSEFTSRLGVYVDAYVDLIEQMCLYIASLKVRNEFFNIENDYKKCIEVKASYDDRFIKCFAKKCHIVHFINEGVYMFYIDEISGDDIMAVYESVARQGTDQKKKKEYGVALLKLKLYVNSFRSTVTSHKGAYNESITMFTKTFNELDRYIKIEKVDESDHEKIAFARYELIKNVLNSYFSKQKNATSLEVFLKSKDILGDQDIAYDNVHDKELIEESMNKVFKKNSRKSTIIDDFLSGSLCKKMKADLKQKHQKDIEVFFASK